MEEKEDLDDIWIKGGAKRRGRKDEARRRESDNNRDTKRGGKGDRAQAESGISA